jgi:uncharacterized protein YgiM (DUF1202 family)
MLARLFRVALGGALLFSLAWSLAPRLASAADIAVHDVVVVNTDFLNLRSDAGTDGSIRATLPQGILLQVTDGPREDDGYTWYKVNVLGDSDNAGLAGWVAADFIALDEPNLTFDTAKWVEVVDGPVNLRDAAGLEGDVLDTLATGEFADVVTASDVATADGFDWIEVSQDNGETGWLATDFLAALDVDPGISDPGDDDDATGFEDAEGVEVVDGPVNVRRSAGLDGTVISTLQSGAQVPVNVAASPSVVTADGFEWIAVRFGNGIPGFVATDFLSPLSFSPNLGSSDALSPFVDVEGAFVTDGPVNLRAEPGTSSEILLTLDNGDYLWIAQPVIDNTATVGDYVWIMVSVAGETGWVAIDFISPAE